MKISVFGIGQMGFPMARRLCEAGHRVTVWNRSRDKAEPLAAHGATIATSAAQAAHEAEMIVSLLSDGPATEQVLFGDGAAADTMRPGTLMIDMASTQPREARDHAARLAALGISHLDAPVSGGIVGAESGKLAIMVGGKPADFERARPVFSVFGHATHVGPHGSGQLTKLANQLIVSVTVGTVAEALLLAARGGADMAKVREAMSGGFADSPILQHQGGRMIRRDFAKQGSVAVIMKDLQNALETAGEIGFEAPIARLFHDLYASACDHGLAELDHSAIFVELAARNGMS